MTTTQSSQSVGPLTTPLTELLSIRHPILLAGMAHTSTAPLAAAVSSAGGLGTIGGLGYSPDQLREMIKELKSLLPDASLPFGIDLALPQVGGSARKTNHDYTKGQLDQLVEVIVEEGTKLFISAVGIPPERVIRRLHEGGVLIMNMVGKPEHADKAFRAGVDIVCAQGGEGGGHTGEIPMGILVPACVQVARRYRPKMLHGKMGLVVAAGGIYNGSGLAGSLAMGAVGVWVGTRFVASEEANCSQAHKEAVVSAGWNDTVRTVVITGRPLRAKKNKYIDDWEQKQETIRSLTSQGVVPFEQDIENDRDVDMPYLMGQVAGAIGDIRPAKEIVDDMVKEAVDLLETNQGYLTQSRTSKM